jgi:hypothetical protein
LYENQSKIVKIELYNKKLYVILGSEDVEGKVNYEPTDGIFEGEKNFADGYWHSVQLYLKYPAYSYWYVDDVPSGGYVTKEKEIHFSEVFRDSEIYIGGQPDLSHLKREYSHKFEGCLRNLEIAGRDVHFTQQQYDNQQGDFALKEMTGIRSGCEGK